MVNVVLQEKFWNSGKPMKLKLILSERNSFIPFLLSFSFFLSPSVFIPSLLSLFVLRPLFLLHFSEHLKGRDHSEELGVEGKMILECILGKQAWGLRIGFIWLRIGTSGGLLWTRWCTFKFHRWRGIFHFLSLGIFLFIIAFRPALGPTQAPIQ
jgi:hypothetical protein